MEQAEVGQSPSPVRVVLALLTAVVAADLAIGLWDVGAPRSPLIGLLVFVFLGTQVGLHAAWTALGTGRWYWRALAIVPLAAIVWWYLHVWPNLENVVIGQILAAQWGFVAVTTTTLRVIGFRVVRVLPSDGGAARPAQYSLRDLGVMVTLSAAWLGFFVQLGRSAGGPWADLLPVALVGGTLALATLLPVVAVLIPRRPRWPAALVLVAAASVGALVGFLLSGGQDALLVALWFVVPLAVPTVALAVFRWQGYQIRRDPRRAAPGDSAPSP